MQPDSERENPPLITFFLLLLLLSIPVWLVGGNSLPGPVQLPVSSLMALLPMLAAAILVYRQDGSTGVKALFRKTFDGHKIRNKLWYLPILLVSPLIFFLSYIVMRLAGRPLPVPEIPWVLAPVFFVVYFIFAMGEELGWMGYAVDPLQNRWGFLKAAIILGLVWSLWHLIPDIQNAQPAGWIFWHRLGSVAMRVLIVWFYNLTGRSVLSAILIHDMNNVCWTLFPNYGSHYDPLVTTLVTLLVVLGVLVWKPKSSINLDIMQKT